MIRFLKWSIFQETNVTREGTQEWNKRRNSLEYGYFIAQGEGNYLDERAKYLWDIAKWKDRGNVVSVSRANDSFLGVGRVCGKNRSWRNSSFPCVVRDDGADKLYEAALLLSSSRLRSSFSRASIALPSSSTSLFLLRHSDNLNSLEPIKTRCLTFYDWS